MIESEYVSDDLETERFMTRLEVSMAFGVSIRQIERAIAESNLAYYQLGGWKRFRRSDVIDWIERQRR